MKYAKIERERRYLLHELPADFSLDAAHSIIVDRYIRNARFRLRRMTSSMTGESIYKLTQKFAHTANLAAVQITNTYLNEREYALFAQLPADELHKRRYRYGDWVIDVFEGILTGLILAEQEVASDEELASMVMPAFAVADVTEELRYTGGELAKIHPKS